MKSLKDSAAQFLALETLAVAGLSSKKKNPANYIYEKLKKAGKKVYPINPKSAEIGGDPCYSTLGDIPEQVDGVIIGTSPEVTVKVVEDCIQHHIKNVWIHKSIDNGSYSKTAEDLCVQHHINLIPAACPMMFIKPVDFPHKCLKWFLTMGGKIPRTLD